MLLDTMNIGAFIALIAIGLVYLFGAVFFSWVIIKYVREKAKSRSIKQIMTDLGTKFLILALALGGMYLLHWISW